MPIRIQETLTPREPKIRASDCKIVVVNCNLGAAPKMTEAEYLAELRRVAERYGFAISSPEGR